MSKSLGLIVILLACTFTSFGQSDNQAAKNYVYYPVFIYNFCKYIQWPNQGDEIVIGVLGNSPIIPQLQRMANAKSTPTMRFVIRKFNAEEEVADCHVLFLPNSFEPDIELLYKQVENKSILFITENEKYIRKYSSINFIIVKGKPLFQMNRRQMAKSRLKVSQKLVSLAIVI